MIRSSFFLYGKILFDTGDLANAEATLVRFLEVDT
jgi:hypothetical protein